MQGKKFGRFQLHWLLFYLMYIAFFKIITSTITQKKGEERN